jgi:hypothetical protein
VSYQNFNSEIELSDYTKNSERYWRERMMFGHCGLILPINKAHGCNSLYKVKTHNT